MFPVIHKSVEAATLRPGLPWLKWGGQFWPRPPLRRPPSKSSVTRLWKSKISTSQSITYKHTPPARLNPKSSVTQRGSAALETALFLPVLFLLLLGTVEIAKITYTYYALEKIMYSLARYVGTQQGVNFCDDGDPIVAAAKNFVLTGTADGSGAATISNLTADMLSVRIERANSISGTLDQCDCSPTGCDTANGGLPPDFIVVSIPQGYPITPHIPLLPAEPIPLKPQVRVPYGGT